MMHTPQKTLFLSVVFCVIVFVSSFYFVSGNTNQVINPTGKKSESLLPTTTVISEVAKVVTLPKDEEPAISSVLDAEKLKHMPFFKDAKNGDQILLYTKNKMTILYRPSTKQIIKKEMLRTLGY